MSEITTYGRRQVGSNQFVIIAPHAAGDDLKTGVIAKRLAKKTNSFFVVNSKFIKPTNARADNHPKRVEDFNKLRWGPVSRKYFWKRKKPAMKQFYKDVSNFCDKAKGFSKDDKAVAIYIHGMNRNHGNVIDIGCGVKKINKSNILLGSLKHRKSGKNSGKVTLQIKKIKKLQKLLSEAEWNGEKFDVTIGQIHPGWSKHGAIQFHKSLGRDDYALQLEFGTTLRSSEEAINYTVNHLSKIIGQVFK